MAGLLDDPKPQTANPIASALNTMGAGLTSATGAASAGTTTPTAPDKTDPFPSPTGGEKPIAPDKTNPLPLPNPTPAPAPVPASPAPPVAPDNRTVEERLNGLLDANSDYIKRARNEGMMVANRRGLQNSSIAAGAAQGAAIDRALPIAQQDADIAAQNSRLGLSIQAEKDRLAQAAGYDMERLQTDAANNLVRDAAQAKNAQELAKVQSDLQSKLQAQGNTEQIQRMGIDLANQLTLTDKQLAGDLAKITASGNEDIRRLVEAGNQERITLQQSIAAQDRQAMASAMVNIFQIENQLRSALLSNDKISATERAAYENTITKLGQPIRDFMNRLFGPDAATGASALLSGGNGLIPDASANGGGGAVTGTPTVGTGGGGDSAVGGTVGADSTFNPSSNPPSPGSIDNPLPGYGNGLLGDPALLAGLTPEQRATLGVQ